MAGAEPRSMTGTIMEMLSILTRYRDENISESDAQAEMVRILRAGVRNVAGRARKNEPIDIKARTAETTQMPGAEPLDMGGDEGKQDKSGGIFAFCRGLLRQATTDITKELGIGSVGDILNSDLRRFFGLPTDDTPLTMGAEKIGQVLGFHTPIPGGTRIGGEIGKVLGALVENAVTFPDTRLLMQAEFCEENLRMMQDFGVRQAELAEIAERYFERFEEFDAEWKRLAAENENAKKAVADDIGKLGVDVEEALNKLKGRP